MGLVSAVLVAGVAGAGASVYGANQQSSDTAAANAANQSSVAQTNQANWNNYLLQRGLSTGGTTPTGVVPGVGAGGAVNTKLPIWANVDYTTPDSGKSILVKTGTPAAKTGLGNLDVNTGAATPAAAPAQGGAGGMSFGGSTPSPVPTSTWYSGGFGGSVQPPNVGDPSVAQPSPYVTQP